MRGFDEDLQREIRRLAEHEGISLNRAVLRLLRKGAGLAGARGLSDVVGADLDHLAGTWSEEDERAYTETQEDFESIDPELWS